MASLKNCVGIGRMEAEKMSSNTALKKLCHHVADVMAVVKPVLFFSCSPMNQAEVWGVFLQQVHPSCLPLQQRLTVTSFERSPAHECVIRTNVCSLSPDGTRKADNTFSSFCVLRVLQRGCCSTSLLWI